jgi:CHRD domain-containing protein
MKHKKIAVLASAVAMMVCIGIVALAVAHGDKGRSLRATLRGIEEPPSVITEASGQFKATISRDESSIQYELSFENLQGTVTQGHIHVGQKGVNGGISVWLCQTATNPAPPQSAATVPVCPQSGTVTGTITANTASPTRTYTPRFSPAERLVGKSKYLMTMMTTTIATEI